eukprot:31499-Pelagococcus_subviridis.AAC.21
MNFLARERVECRLCRGTTLRYPGADRLAREDLRAHDITKNERNVSISMNTRRARTTRVPRLAHATSWTSSLSSDAFTSAPTRSRMSFPPGSLLTISNPNPATSSDRATAGDNPRD